MQIKEFSPSEFSKLESAWTYLEKGKDMTAFQAYGWFKNINSLYSREKVNRIFRKWVYILLEDNGVPILIAPLRVQFFGASYKHIIGVSRGVYFIGKDSYSDYLNFIYREINPSALLCLFDYIKNRYGISYFALSNIIAETESAKIIRSTFQCKVTEVSCANLKIPERFSDYTDALSKNTRQNLRTAVNRLKKDGIELSTKMLFEFNDALLVELSAMREIRLEKKRRKSADGYDMKKFILEAYSWFEGLFRAEHRVLYNSHNPWCLVAKDGEEIASYFWGICNDDRTEFYVILAAVKPKYERYSPGKVSIFQFVEGLYTGDAQAIKFIDFTRGGEKYKYELGAQDRETHWLLEFRV